MKEKRSPAGTLMLLLLLLAWQPGLAQHKIISGKVVDSTDGSALPGASVMIRGTQQGTITKPDGSFSIPVGEGSTLSISLIGYETKAVPATGGRLTVALSAIRSSLNEIVVVGYGTSRKKDLTGSVATINVKDFQQGAIATPEQLIAGKVPGVLITSNGGAPGSGSVIRIRGGASLNASNDPLIVLDNVPLETGASASIKGSANPLNLFNPNDIETFSILKDASAAAIFGSRASNGVIMITTKRGKTGDLSVNFNSSTSLNTPTKKVDVLSAQQFRDVVNTKGNAAQKALLGNSVTDWQKEIFNNSLTADNNISLTGGIKNLPYRLSVGYLNTNGILLTTRMNRASGLLNINPVLFKDRLKINFSVKASLTNTRFADQGAIASAIQFDPTQPVHANNVYGNYFEWTDPSTGKPNIRAARNPVSMLELKHDEGKVKQLLTNIQLDYRIFSDLHANLNLGYETATGNGNVTVPPYAALQFLQGGQMYTYEQRKRNKLMDFYLNYTKDFKKIQSHLEVTAGYTYQDWLRQAPAYDNKSTAGSVINTTPADSSRETFIAFIGRLNYNFKGKYYLTATLAQNGSSHFAPQNRWGIFPAIALAWKINEENFLKRSTVLTDLKLRLGYGVTGQKDIGNNYAYINSYLPSNATAQYPFGDQFYTTLRPAAYDPDIKWEQTTTYNIGLDFGFLKNRIYGSIDVYRKTTTNLLSFITTAAGTNFSNYLYTNVGSLWTKGIEFNINANAVETRHFTWNTNFNITYNKIQITRLNKTDDPSFAGILVGGIAGGVGSLVQIHSVGHAPSSFYVNKQVYGSNGLPVEGLYADLNKDGLINNSDLYRYKSPNPAVFIGFSNTFTYDKWSLYCSMRANIGNYVYNNIYSLLGNYNKTLVYSDNLSNTSSNVLATNFNLPQYLSDYYVENASFLRMDNLRLAYNFGKIIRKTVSLNIAATVQNVFTITKYQGLDPEISSGIDNNFYPRPRIYTLGVNLGF